jgi:hypothetical protein
MMGKLNTFSLLLLLGCLPATVSAQAAELVGTVILTNGSTSAVDGSGVSRNLIRRSAIFTGDRIITGPDGFAQIRMIDSAIFSVKEDTELTLRDYVFDGAGGNPDRVVLELHKGGIRTITGIVGDEDNHEYLLITPAMDVVPHGTTYECIVENGKTTCGVSDGGITVSNETGSVLLGLGGNHDYAEAENRQSAISPLMAKPSVLGTITVQPNPATPVQTPRPSNSVTPLTNSISFPTPAPIRVVPYKI